MKLLVAIMLTSTLSSWACPERVQNKPSTVLGSPGPVDSWSHIGALEGVCTVVSVKEEISGPVKGRRTIKVKDCLFDRREIDERRLSINTFGRFGYDLALSDHPTFIVDNMYWARARDCEFKLASKNISRSVRIKWNVLVGDGAAAIDLYSMQEK